MAKFADFVASAEKVAPKHKPYELEIGDKVYSIEAPDARAMLALSEADPENLSANLRAIFANNTRAYAALLRELEGKPVEAVMHLIEDMTDFWDGSDNVRSGKGRA